MGLYLYNNLNDMMRKILSFVCAALLVAGLCGCEKIDVNKLEGTWTEQYDPTVFAMDGSVEYTWSLRWMVPWSTPLTGTMVISFTYMMP